MSIPTISAPPAVQQFDLIPLRSMGDDEIFETACNDFWPRVKPFAEDLTAAGDWIGTVYIAMGEAYQLTADAAQTAIDKAGEAAGSAQTAGEHAQTAQNAIAVLEPGAIVNGDPAPNTAWPSERTAQELALKRGLSDASYPSVSQTGTGTVTLDLWLAPSFRHAVTGTTTFEFANEEGAGKSEPVALYLYDASLGTRVINYPAGVSFGDEAPEFEGKTWALVLFFWSGGEWVGSVGAQG